MALAEESPDRPELLVDWGNAALGARNFGTAALAYKRALSVDRGNDRAQKNLEWLRARAPDDMPRVVKTGAVDTMFFWHERMSPRGKTPARSRRILCVWHAACPVAPRWFPRLAPTLDSALPSVPRDVDLHRDGTRCIGRRGRRRGRRSLARRRFDGCASRATRTAFQPAPKVK